jgi:hypothetical protein
MVDMNTGAKATEGMFTIVARRANFVDIEVKGDIITNLVVVPETNTSLEPINKDANLVLYNNKIEDVYKARVTVLNSGNI